jgi:hypothetical protein
LREVNETLMVILGYNLIYTDPKDYYILIIWRTKREEKMGAGIASSRKRNGLAEPRPAGAVFAVR